MADDIEAKRQCAVYARHIAWCRTYSPEMSDEAMDAEALQKVDESVHGVGAKKDRHGHYISRAIGAPGFESGNHFAAILKYEGKAAYDKAVAEIWKRDPDRASKLSLPQPAR